MPQAAGADVRTGPGAPRCIGLAGPTASGKTAAAMAIARQQPVEIVSVDSALVYRGMDIGTAKPGAASALNGFLVTLAAFAMGGWLGTHMDGSVFPLTNGVWFWSAMIALSGWTLVQKYGEPARAANSGR